MGCASSSPLTVNGGPGGLVESAKSAATEIMSTGEKAINGNCYFFHIHYKSYKKL